MSKRARRARRNTKMFHLILTAAEKEQTTEKRAEKAKTRAKQREKQDFPKGKARAPLSRTAKGRALEKTEKVLGPRA